MPYGSIRIVLLSIAAAMFFGIVLDQVTARVCVEYFTIGHKPILGGAHAATALGFGWGIASTWRAGLLIGIPLAVACQVGELKRKLAWVELIKPMAVVLAMMAVAAFAAGAIAYKKGVAGTIVLQDPLSWQVPFDVQSRFIGCAGAQFASYAAGFVGGLLLCGYVGVVRLRSRRK